MKGVHAGFALTVLVLTGCPSDPGMAGPPDTGRSADGGGPRDTGPQRDAFREDGGMDDYPTFETDILPILNRSCGSATVDCHDRAAYGRPPASSACRGWLSMVNEPMGAEGCPDRDLYRRLVDLDAWGCETADARMRYVTPCDPGSSYLFRKIGGGPYCQNFDGTASVAMPVDMPLPAGEITLIEQWILAGAPRDGEPRVDCTDPPVGTAPVADIWHPSSGEDRRAGLPIPMIGRGMDTEDGTLTGDALVWTSDREGEIGRGEMFDFTPRTLGAQVITLTARDSDSRTGTESITLQIIP